MHTHTRQAAWLQGALLVAACAAIAAMLAWRLQRPFDRDTLAIQVGRLQSHAAEAQLLADSVREDRLAPGFVRQHALQLAHNVDTVQARLEQPARPEWSAVESSARRLGGSLHQELQRLGRDGRLPRTRSMGFGEIAQRLQSLHAQLKPGEAGG